MRMQGSHPAPPLDTAGLADTRALIKNPALDAGSGPAMAGQTYEPPANVWRLFLFPESLNLLLSHDGEEAGVMNEQPPAYDAVSTDFLVLIGRIVIGWSRIERALDIAVAAVYGKAPRPLTKKVEAMHELCKQVPSLIPHSTWIATRLDDITELAKYRHTIIHGFFHGVSYEDEPQIYFRRAAPLTGEPGERVLATRAVLEEFIQKVRKADHDFMILMILVTQDVRKARQSISHPILPSSEP